MLRIVVQRQVEFAETDMAGIVHFSHFFRWMESAEHALFRKIGISIHTRVGGQSFGWPRVSCKFDYKRPLVFEDCIEIHMDLVRIGTSSLSFRCRVMKDGECAAEGESTSVCVEEVPGGGMSKVSIPPEIRAKLQG